MVLTYFYYLYYLATLNLCFPFKSEYDLLPKMSCVQIILLRTYHVFEKQIHFDNLGWKTSGPFNENCPIRLTEKALQWLKKRSYIIWSYTTCFRIILLAPSWHSKGNYFSFRQHLFFEHQAAFMCMKLCNQLLPLVPLPSTQLKILLTSLM